MNVLVIGGNRFVGYQLVWRLLAEGHHVTVLNRGSRQHDALKDKAGHIVADRSTTELVHALKGLCFDAVVDFAAFTGDDSQLLLRALSPSQVGHYVVVSTGQVYLVREECPRPAKESDYVGTVMSQPSDPNDVQDWLYGVNKRDMEDRLQTAWTDNKFPVTILRIPIVNGELDHQRRLESYFWRIMDRGPILLPDGGTKLVRPVYSMDVVRFISRLLGKPDSFGEAINLCQNEARTVAQIVESMAECMGTRAEIRSITEEALTAVGLTPKAISPLHTRWTSFLDNSKAKASFGFNPEEMNTYLDKIMNFFINSPQSSRPENYKNREIELSLAARL